MESLVGDDCFTCLDKTQYILFYFTASWCGPCQKIYPDILELIKTLSSDQILFYKIDIDDESNNEICEKCNIKSVPTFLLFKNRTLISQTKGADINNIINMINNNCK